jgi:hypothetical protein
MTVVEQPQTDKQNFINIKKQPQAPQGKPFVTPLPGDQERLLKQQMRRVTRDGKRPS